MITASSSDRNGCVDNAAVEECEGPLAGLLIAEAEFEQDDDLAAFETPHFALREITSKPQFSGYNLAAVGLTSGMLG